MPFSNKKGFTLSLPKTPKKVLVALCLVAVAAGGIRFMGSRQPSAPVAVKAQPALTVTTVKVQEALWPEEIKASGNVQPWQESVIGTEVGGLRLTHVLANVGDTVKKGQVLARLNPVTVQADLAAAKASVAEAEANLSQAEATLDRGRRLEPLGGVSQQDLAQYETQRKTAAAKLAVARAQQENQALKLGFTTLVAPDDGIISSRTAAEGAIVQAGGELFRLIRQGRLEWRAEVKGDNLLKIVEGQEVSVKHPLGTTIRGSVRKVSPVVDVTSRNGQVFVDFTEPANLKTGLYVTGAIKLKDSKALVVPQASVVTRDGKTLVFGLDANNRVQGIPVVTGRQQESKVEVLSGVTLNTTVVQQGAGFLKSGDLVQVVAPQDAKEVK